MIQKARTFYLAGWRGGKAVLANWAIVLFGLIASQGIAALVLIIVARRVMPVEYGQYLSCYALASLLIVLPNYGLETWLLAESSVTLPKLVAGWKSAIRLRLRLLLAWLAGMAMLGMLLPADAFPSNILIPTTLGLACDSLVLVSYSVLRSLSWHRRVTSLQLIASLALLGVTLALPPEHGRIMLFSVSRAAVSAVLAVVVVTMTHNSLRVPATFAPADDLLRTARPFMLSDLFASVYLKADLTIVSLFLGSSGASIYGPALTLINVSFLVPNALYLAVMPIIARIYRKTGVFGRMGVVQLILQMLTGATIAGAMFGLSQVMINLVFGSAYEPSVLVLRFLSPIPFFKSLNFGLALLLTVGQHQNWRTSAQMLCAIFNVAGNLLIVIPFGVVGVSIVYTLSEGLLLGGYSLGVYRWWLDRRKNA